MVYADARTQTQAGAKPNPECERRLSRRHWIQKCTDVLEYWQRDSFFFFFKKKAVRRAISKCECEDCSDSSEEKQATVVLNLIVSESNYSSGL